MSEEENDMKWWIEEALAELENARGALYKLNRETDALDDVEYYKITRAIWDVEDLLKERRDL